MLQRRFSPPQRVIWERISRARWRWAEAGRVHDIDLVRRLRPVTGQPSEELDMIRCQELSTEWMSGYAYSRRAFLMVGMKSLLMIESSTPSVDRATQLSLNPPAGFGWQLDRISGG